MPLRENIIRRESCGHRGEMGLKKLDDSIIAVVLVVVIALVGIIERGEDAVRDKELAVELLQLQRGSGNDKRQVWRRRRRRRRKRRVDVNAVLAESVGIASRGEDKPFESVRKKRVVGENQMSRRRSDETGSH
jgi:hypothetical protein